MGLLVLKQGGVKMRNGWTKVLAIFLLTVGAIVWFIPFVWMILGFFKTSAELTSSVQNLLPKSWSLDNLRRLFDRAPYGRFYLNSLVVSFASTFGALLTSSIAGYIFAKKQFYGREVIFLGILSMMMIPFTVVLIPLFVVATRLGLVNSLWAVILPFVVHPLGIFLMRQHIETIPNELIEAAIVDGASEFWIYSKVIIPLSKSSLSALAIFIFMFSWNDYLWPLVVLQEQAKLTLPLGIAALQQERWTSFDLTVTAAAITIVPVMLVFLIAQRQIIEGMALTGMKG